MKRAAALAATLLAGMALGAGAIETLHAQGEGPAYVIAEVQVTDALGYQVYLKKAVDSLEPYRAEIVARGRPETKEGTAPEGSIVIVRFDSMADANKWYTTPPYKNLIAERQKAAKTNLYFLQGVPQ